jgi:hypothetical protein
MKAYAFTNGQMNTTPVTTSTETLSFRGGTPSITANGTNNGHCVDSGADCFSESEFARSECR